MQLQIGHHVKINNNNKNQGLQTSQGQSYLWHLLFPSRAPEKKKSIINDSLEQGGLDKQLKSYFKYVEVNQMPRVLCQACKHLFIRKNMWNGWEIGSIYVLLINIKIKNTYLFKSC